MIVRSQADIASHFEAFNDRLAVGDVVEVRWTNSHRYFAARGEVSKLNTHSVRVKLLEATGDAVGGPAYPVGHRILVPRLYQTRWSANNGVFPVPSIQGILIDERGARVVRPARSDAGVREVLRCEDIKPHEFYISTRTELLVGAQFVALQDDHWPSKNMPIYEPAIPLRGPLFIVHRPIVDGGYWTSLSSTDIATFQRLFGVDVREVKS